MLFDIYRLLDQQECVILLIIVILGFWDTWDILVDEVSYLILQDLLDLLVQVLTCL